MNLCLEHRPPVWHCETVRRSHSNVQGKALDGDALPLERCRLPETRRHLQAPTVFTWRKGV